jgi:hypothetical protein
MYAAGKMNTFCDLEAHNFVENILGINEKIIYSRFKGNRLDGE